MTPSNDQKTPDTEYLGDLAQLPPLKLVGDVDCDDDIEPVIVGLAEQLKEWQIEDIYATETDPVVAAAKVAEIRNDQSYEQDIRSGITVNLDSEEPDKSE